MNAFRLFEAINGLDDDTVAEALRLMDEKAPRRRLRFRTLLAAALIASLLAASAAAAWGADFLGIRALIYGRQSQRVLESGSGEERVFTEKEFSDISLTRPQLLPPELSPEIREQLESSGLAWQEWRDYKENDPGLIPPAWTEQAPAQTNAEDISENPDGSYTVSFIEISAGGSEQQRVLKEIIISAGEYGEYLDYCRRLASGLPGYDFMYGVFTPEQGERLEEIAEKYSLELRRQEKLYLGSRYSPEELTELSGGILKEPPQAVDKLCIYNEGSLGMSYSFAAPSGELLSCYLRSSMYSTLSSGSELSFSVPSEEEGSFTQRRLSIDGAELCLLSDGSRAYAYAYLPRSFFAISISPLSGGSLSAGDAEAVLQGISFRLIGG